MLEEVRRSLGVEAVWQARDGRRGTGDGRGYAEMVLRARRTPVAAARRLTSTLAAM